MNKYGLHFFALLLMVTAMASCNNNQLYNQYSEVDTDGWDQDSVIVFEADIQDTVSACDLLIQIRNTDKYSYQNLWLFVDSESPAGIVQKDTIECYLADNTGKWLGKHFFSIYEMPVIYLRIKHFPIKGTYKFHVSQAMREKQLKGISSIGLTIQKRKEDGQE
ncbi:MAG: gliding motility lipoprotein GldH [Paludibacteraceae bacterium]|nr:gliding motility lipoprotein GldH [Paludibacteraceae bacterium]